MQNIKNKKYLKANIKCQKMVDPLIIFLLILQISRIPNVGRYGDAFSLFTIFCVTILSGFESLRIQILETFVRLQSKRFARLRILLCVLKTIKCIVIVFLLIKTFQISAAESRYVFEEVSQKKLNFFPFFFFFFQIHD